MALTPKAITAFTPSGRVAVNQLIDYRIFVVSAYPSSELAQYQNAIRVAMGEKEKPKRLIDFENVGYYTFFKYSIEDFVSSIDISRPTNGSPASLNLELFPIKNDNQNDNDFNLFYLKNYRYAPVFQRMDYIEIQVANLNFSDKMTTAQSDQYDAFQKFLANSNRGVDYSNSSISNNYKIRFRGFITNVIEEDEAMEGRRLKIEAQSMLYYLSVCPLVTDFAIFTNPKTQQNRSHILNGNLIKVTADLLENLDDTSTKTNKFMEAVFNVISNREPVSTSVQPNLANDAEQIYGTISNNGTSEFLMVKDTFRINDIDSLSIYNSISQPSLLPLTEFYYSFKSNLLGNLSNRIYQIMNLGSLFNQSIRLGGINTSFISEYSYFLDTLNKWKRGVRYILYEDASGLIHFERPNLNGQITNIIDRVTYLGYRYTESAINYICDIFVGPSTIIDTIPDNVSQAKTGESGYTLDELRRFGYRRADFERNPNISESDALNTYATTMKAQNNAALKTLSISIPYDKNIDVGKLVWFQEKNLVGYVIEVSESIRYANSSQMRITLSFLREITNISKPVEQITLTDLQKNPAIITVEDFPEYIFTKNFYNGQFGQSTRFSNTFNQLVPPAL